MMGVFFTNPVFQFFRMALCLKVIRTLLAPLGFFELYMHGLAKEKRMRNLLALVVLKKRERTTYLTWPR